jgi:hypothetical protein
LTAVYLKFGIFIVGLEVGTLGVLLDVTILFGLDGAPGVETTGILAS